MVRFDVVADRFQQESNEALTSLLDKYLDLLHDFNDAFELEALGIKELSCGVSYHRVEGCSSTYRRGSKMRLNCGSESLIHSLVVCLTNGF